MIFGFTFVTLISILAVAGVAVYSLKLRHELRLRELEAQSGHPASHPLGREASDLESAVLPDSALQEIHEEGPEEAPEGKSILGSICDEPGRVS